MQHAAVDGLQHRANNNHCRGLSTCCKSRADDTWAGEGNCLTFLENFASVALELD